MYLSITLLWTAEMCSFNENDPERTLEQMSHFRLFVFSCTSRSCFVNDSFSTTCREKAKFMPTTASVSRWLNYFKVCGYLQQCILAQKHNTFAKIRLTFCQILNKPSKMCPRLLNCAKVAKQRIKAQKKKRMIKSKGERLSKKPLSFKLKSLRAVLLKNLKNKWEVMSDLVTKS